MGRQGLLPQAVTGVVGQLVRGVTKDGRSKANRLMKKQGFSAVTAFVETRDQLTPLHNASTKLGDTLTFQITNNHHLTSFTDFRCRLPGLNAAPNNVRNPFLPKNDPNAFFNSDFQARPNNFCINPGVVYSGYTGDNPVRTSDNSADAVDGNYTTNDPSTKWRYRIPMNPAWQEFMGNTDYAVRTGGYPVPHPYAGNYEDIDQPQFYNTSSVSSWAIPNPIWADYIGFWMLEWIEVRYSTAVLMKFSGEDMLKLHLKFHSKEQRDYYRIMTGGHSAGPGWSTQDIIDASYAKDICVPLDLLFWVGKVTEALPITGAARPVEIKIKLRDPQYCYLFQKYDVTLALTDNGRGTNPLTNNFLTPVPVPLQDVRLEVHEYFITGGEQKAILNDLDSNQGYMWKCWDIEKISDLKLDRDRNAVSANITMQGIKGGVNFMFLTKIHAADKETPFACYWTNWLRVNDYEIIAGKEEAYPRTDHFYDQYRLANLHANAPIEATDYNIYCLYYSKIPSDKFNDWGNLEYANLYNPTLKLNYQKDYDNPLSHPNIPAFKNYLNTQLSTGSPIGVTPHIVDITAFVHQFIHFKGGELNKVLG